MIKPLSPVIKRFQVDKFIPDDISDFLDKREWKYVIEVRNNKATAYSCYKDNRGKFYYEICQEMKLYKGG